MKAPLAENRAFSYGCKGLGVLFCYEIDARGFTIGLLGDKAFFGVTL